MNEIINKFLLTGGKFMSEIHKDNLDLYSACGPFTKNNRSSHRRCSVRKGVLKNFAKFTGKHLCQSLFFNKVADLRSATLLKKRL